MGNVPVSIGTLELDVQDDDDHECDHVTCDIEQFKRPLPESYEQAIAVQKQTSTTSNTHESMPNDVEHNLKNIFEKSMRLAR
jgi:hypothetical protein